MYVYMYICICICACMHACMQQPLAYIFQTLFQHEVFVFYANIYIYIYVGITWQHDNCFFFKFLYKLTKNR